MLNHTFTWNGHSSDEFGIKIERFRALNRSARKYDAASVPGRNGNIYGLQNAWEEVLVSYEIFAQGRPATNMFNMTRTSGTLITGTPNGYIINGTTSSTKSVQLYSGTESQQLGYYRIGRIGNLTGISMNYVIQTDQSLPYAGGTVPAEGMDFYLPHGYYLLVTLDVTAGTYSNVLVPCFMGSIYQLDLEAQWTNIMEWLNSADGYAELSDTYDTQHYREAVFVDATDIANSWNQYGRATVSFRCRPERFLSSGQSVTLDFTNTTLIGYVNTWSLTLRASAPSGAVIGTLHEGEVLKILDSIVISSVGWYQVKTEDGTIGWCQSQYVLTYNVLIINNPTKHIAKPKISLTMGSGGLWMMLNRSILEVTGQANPLYIDCETENITGINGLGQPESYNNRATLSDGNGNPISNFLFLKSGENYISIEESDNVSDVTIEMRLWEL